MMNMLLLILTNIMKDKLLLLLIAMMIGKNYIKITLNN